jgi:hypothetical protein
MIPTTDRRVTARHLARNAYLYVRQSTLRQVVENTESTARQYAMRQRALALGWPAEQIVVIDCDQGQSGASAADRAGFQRLAAEVGLGHAGIVLGLEASRLARSSTDWHRLLELCALGGTLLLDEDGLYDPGQFNYRLLLGLKRPAAYSTPCSTSAAGIGHRAGQDRLICSRPGMSGAAFPAVAAAQVADVQAGEGASEGGAPAQLIEPAGDLGVADARRQLPDHGERLRWRLERPVARTGPVHQYGGDRAGAPVDLDLNLAGLGPAIEVHGRDGEAEQLLALPVGGGLRVPDRRQILRQRVEGGPLLVGERDCGRPL